MKVISIDQLAGTEREVHCPKGGFVSMRYILNRDGMGFSLHKTFIPRGDVQFWHYKYHLEACYCVSGVGILKNIDTGETHKIEADCVYALDMNDKHSFHALSDVILISVFNPPLNGGEVHAEDGSYEA